MYSMTPQPQPPRSEPSYAEELAEGWDDGGDEWESFEQPKTSDGWDDNWGDDFSSVQVGKWKLLCEKCITFGTKLYTDLFLPGEWSAAT